MQSNFSPFINMGSDEHDNEIYLIPVTGDFSDLYSQS